MRMFDGPIFIARRRVMSYVGKDVNVSSGSVKYIKRKYSFKLRK